MKRLLLLSAALLLVTACGQPFQRWDTHEVVEAFRSAGLEAEVARTMTKDDYGLAPMVAEKGTRFLIPSLCDDCGGRIFSFQDEEARDETRAYYVGLGEASAMLFSWILEADNILVQINGDLPEDTAALYREALEAMQ